MTSCRLSRCGAAHVPVLAALHARAFDEPWREREIADLLAMPGTGAWLATHRWPAGFVLWRAVADEAEILTIAVHDRYRRRGIGRALMDAAEAAAAENGVRRMILEVAVDNVAALGLYGARGYERVGVRTAYYARGEAVRVDADILDRELPGARAEGAAA